jgi:hypothetical protein
MAAGEILSAGYLRRRSLFASGGPTVGMFWFLCSKKAFQGDWNRIAEWNSMDGYRGNTNSGKPRFSFRRKAKELLETNQIQRAFITLSHDRPCAVAHVILEGKNDEGSDR